MFNTSDANNKEFNFHYQWFIGLLALEALLSIIDLSNISIVNALSKSLSEIFPVVMHFDGEAKNFQIARNYIAVTILLLPGKILFGYLWLQHKRGEALRTVLVSPYSENRSLFAKVIFLVGICAITLGASWYVLWGFGDDSFGDYTRSLLSQRNKYALVLRNGLPMWLSWALMHMMILGFAWGAFVLTIKEWLGYLGILSKQE